MAIGGGPGDSGRGKNQGSVGQADLIVGRPKKNGKKNRELKVSFEDPVVGDPPARERNCRQQRRDA